jgi:hypothetical protein
MSGGITNDKDFASLPNSRIRPRKATDAAFSYKVLAQHPNGAGYTDDQFDTSVDGPSDATTEATDRGKSTTNGNTILIEKNTTRTYVTLRNLDSENSINYGYTDDPDMEDDGSGITLGQSLEGAGMTLKAGDSVDLEVPNCIYVRSIATDDSHVIVAVDYGIG